MEEAQFDKRHGRIMNPSFAEYQVPARRDVPEIDVIWTDMEGAFETSDHARQAAPIANTRCDDPRLIHLMPGADRTDGHNPRRTNGLHDSKFMQAVGFLKVLVGPE